MEPPVQESALVQHDLLCMKCQYNLRTRPKASQCPECGQRVQESLAHHAVYAGAILEPATLRLAAYCFGVPSLLSVGACVGMYAIRVYEHGGAPTTADMLLEYAAHIVFVAALLLGVFLLGGSVSRVVAAPSTRILLALLAAVYGAINVFFSLIIISTLIFGRGGRGGPLPIWMAQTAMQEQRIGTAVMCLVMSLAGYKIMRSLSRALASTRLLSLTRLAFGAMLADAGLTLIFLIIAGAMIPRRDPNRFASLFAAVDLGSAMIYAGFGWYWLIVARMVRERTQPAVPEMAESGPAKTVRVEEKIGAFLAHRKGEVGK